MGGAHSASGAGRGEIRVSAVRIRKARRRGQVAWPRRAIPMQLSRVPMDADILRCLHLHGPGLPRPQTPGRPQAQAWGGLRLAGRRKSRSEKPW
ncbi:uncharacterized protein BDW70DRAFT_142332 [Aspergillus foveolatus]|uniref:uncharacterized protein n=1 Tax=Aspergillus foveolatus TaxID=210207 RepID=UPI003CCE447B